MNGMKKATLVAGLLSVLFVTGCAGYGRLISMGSGPGETVTVSTLVDRWQDYDTYAANLNSALIFAVKGGEREVTTSGHWERVESREALERIVNDIASQPPVGDYFPRLWKMVGPDGHLYGYMFTAWDHAVMSEVKENTLRVWNIKSPPFMKYR